jgi:predicted dehydrogenase
MIRIGIVGAGAICEQHICAYKNNPECKVIAIADLNLSLAKSRAEKYEIEKVYADYKELLSDKEIDAVSIVTPTFTHAEIVIAALKSGKNVLCEKPPALTADEVRECAKTAKETNRLLMFAFVCRFSVHTQFLKKYIDSGKMGQITYAEANRVSRCIEYNGWFCDKKKSGGFLFDGTIHELDAVLYLMGYPKPKTILGYTTDINNDLPEKIKSVSSKYTSLDTNNYDRTIESFANATIILDNGACIHVKSGCIFNAVVPGAHIELCGKNAGAKMNFHAVGKELEFLELSEDGYFNNTVPVIAQKDSFLEEINHFVDCCENKTECICKPEEAVTLIEIINAIYKSADTGKAIEF